MPRSDPQCCLPAEAHLGENTWKIQQTSCWSAGNRLPVSFGNSFTEFIEQVTIVIKCPEKNWMCYSSILIKPWIRQLSSCQPMFFFFFNFIYVLSNWTYHFNLTIQGIMDPSRNFSRYRNLIKSDTVKPPLIPIFPMVSKDLSFIHIGNKTKKGDLVNFEKMRLVAKESLPLLLRIKDMAE